MAAHHLSRTFVAASLIVLAFAFLGSRGLWEPDEGRYVGAAREMVLSGDWLVPQLHGAPHLTKPPGAYWAIAAGLRTIGMNGWGARLYLALSFLATCALTGLLGRELLGPGRGRLSALAFGLSLLPFAAASVATTDMLLAACETAAVYGWWRARGATGTRARIGWQAATGAAFGLAFLVKGPPGLLPIAGLAVWEIWRGRRDGRALAAWGPPAAAGFVIVALPWYLWAVTHLPGLAGYFLGEEVVARVASGAHHRNAGLGGAARIYGLALLAGGLPFSPVWIARGVRRAVGRLRGTPTAAGHGLGEHGALLACWFAIPMAVFLLASSRMYLYIVPLFVPLSLMTVGRAPEGAHRRLTRPLALALVATWVLLLAGLRWQAATLESTRDARRLAGLVAPLASGPPLRIEQVDVRIHGLDFYLDRRTEVRVSAAADVPEYWPRRPARPALDRIARSPLRHLLLAPPPLAERLAARLSTPGRPARLEPLTPRISAVVVPAAARARTARRALVAAPEGVAQRFVDADAIYQLCETEHPEEIVVAGQGRRAAPLAGLLWDLPAEGVTVRTEDAEAAPAPGIAWLFGTDGSKREVPLAADVHAPAPGSEGGRR